MPTNSALKVLYIEDNPIQVRSGSRTLRRIGANMVIVDTGASALKTIETQTFDLILFDLRLPDMDGFELLDYLHHKIPEAAILVLTGFGPPGLREKCLQSGAADVLIKPVDPNDLEAALRKYLPVSGSDI